MDKAFLNSKERRAVREVVEHGRQWGFGNMIHRLRIAWILALRKGGFDWKTACLAAGSSRKYAEDINKQAEQDESALLLTLKKFIDAPWPAPMKMESQP